MYGSILYHENPSPLFYSRSWAELWPEISDRLINYHRTSRTRTIRKFITRSKYLFFLPHLPFTLHNRTITLVIHSSLHHQPNHTLCHTSFKAVSPITKTDGFISVRHTGWWWSWCSSDFPLPNLPFPLSAGTEKTYKIHVRSYNATGGLPSKVPYQALL